MTDHASVARVRAYLNAHGWSGQIVRFDQSTRTAQDAATAIGCDVAQIVKSLVFQTQPGHQPVLVLTSGANRVDETALEQALGASIGKANATFVRDQTGYAIGGVPPVAHTQSITTLIDQDLMQFAVIWAAAGHPHAVFELTPAELVRLTGGRVVRVTNESALQ